MQARLPQSNGELDIYYEAQKRVHCDLHIDLLWSHEH